MNLIRIRLDPLKRQTVRALTNPNCFHGAIEAARPGERTRILWRIDSLKGQTYLLLLSQAALNVQALIEQFGYPGEKAQQAEYSRLLEKIRDGSRWNFRLCANPVSAQAPKNGRSRGKVFAHVSIRWKMEWLLRQQKNWGFEIDPQKTRVVDSRWIQFRKSGATRPVRLQQTTFEGILRITDADLFKKALTEGIGKGKAYGMGLLTVIPVHE